MPEPLNLVEVFSVLPDPRIARGKEHRLVDLLVIAVCTLLTGGESFYDMAHFARMREGWLRGFLALPGGPPSHDTFNRLFAVLDPAAFAETFATWTESVRAILPAGQREIVALDGKAARRAVNAGENTRYLVSAWATENGLALGQVQVADKSNEITAVPALLRALELTGCVVTADALHCQRNTAKEIVEADADYVLALKGNQGVAHQEIKDDLDDAIARADPKLTTLETIEKGHGRIETRRYWQSADLGWFTDGAEWEGLRSVGVVEAIRDVNGKVSPRAALLPEQPARGRASFCPGGAWPLGHGKQPALGLGRGHGRRPKPCPQRLCRRQLGRGPPPGLKPPAPRPPSRALHQAQTTSGCLRHRLSRQLAKNLMRQP